MYAVNSTINTTDTQAQAHTTETNGPTWTTTQPATHPPKTRRPLTRWTAEDAAYSPDRYKEWLQSLDSIRWQEIYGQHSPADLDRAIAVCRYYKSAKAKYDANPKRPESWTARLNQLHRHMTATIKALHFENPRALWAAYQWTTYRDPNGYSPDHGAHIANVDHYLWLRDVTAALSIDNNDGGYTSPYPNNADAALEAARTPRLEYAVTDDADNPQYQLAAIQRQLGHASRKRQTLAARIKTATDAPTKQKLAARYNAVAVEIKQLAAEADELTRLLTPPTNEDGEYEISPDQWAKQIAYQTADYGLSRCTPAAPGTARVDVFNQAAEANDAIQNLLDLQRQSQELIAYIESVQATGKALTPTQTRMYAEALDLLPVITASLAAQTARTQA